MAKNNAVNLDITNNADGYDISGGTTVRKLTVTGSDITLTGSGSNVYTFPSATATLVGTSSTDTLTNKTIDADNNTISNIVLGAEATGALENLSNVTLTTVGSDELLFTQDGTTWINQTLTEAGISAVGHTHAASEITDFDTEVSNNTDVAANTTHRTSNGSDHTFIDQDVTSGSAPNLANTNMTGNISVWTNNSGYITAASTDTLTNKTIDANGTGNSISNIEVADIAAAAKAGGGSVLATEFSKSITVESPTSSEDISIFFTNDAITVTEMRAVVRGTSPSVTWTIRHGTDRSATGAEVVTGGTATTSQTTGSDVTSFNDATIVADSFVWLETTAASGTNDELHITIFYTID